MVTDTQVMDESSLWAILSVALRDFCACSCTDQLPERIFRHPPWGIISYTTKHHGSQETTWVLNFQVNTFHLLPKCVAVQLLAVPSFLGHSVSVIQIFSQGQAGTVAQGHIGMRRNITVCVCVCVALTVLEFTL